MRRVETVDALAITSPNVIFLTTAWLCAGLKCLNEDGALPWRPRSELIPLEINHLLFVPAQHEVASHRRAGRPQKK